MCRIMVVHCFACEVMGYLFFAQNIGSAHQIAIDRFAVSDGLPSP